MSYKGKHYGATWQDKERISWGISDQNLSEIAAEQVKKEILEVGNRRVILVTHVVTHPDSLFLCRIVYSIL